MIIIKQLIMALALLLLSVSAFATNEASVSTRSDEFRWPLLGFYGSIIAPYYGAGVGFEQYMSEYESATIQISGSRELLGISGIEFQSLYHDGPYSENGTTSYRGWTIGGYRYAYFGLPFGWKWNNLHGMILPNMFYFEVMPAISSEIKGYLIFKFGVRSDWRPTFSIRF